MTCKGLCRGGAVQGRGHAGEKLCRGGAVQGRGWAEEVLQVGNSEGVM